MKLPQIRFRISGRFRFNSYRAGSDILIAQTAWIPNLVVNAGLQEVLEDLMEARATGIPISTFKLGTGVTAPDAADTDLETPTVTTDFIANRSRIDQTILFEFFLADGEVPDDDYTECGMFIGTTMFSHAAISPTYEKAANQDTKVDYEVTLSAI